MIIMNLELDNFFAFRNFKLNMSYPKKIVDSSIENEFLTGRENFRYKKVNILMGANATGKTSIGKMLMRIFNFIDKKRGIQDYRSYRRFWQTGRVFHGFCYRVISVVSIKCDSPSSRTA